MSDLYILDSDGEPTAEPDSMAWGRWFHTAKRHVGDSQVGDSRISTVFLGLDHSFARGGPPVLWETMVFGGPLDGETDRCAGPRSFARSMHARMVERVRAVPFWRRWLAWLTARFRP